MQGVWLYKHVWRRCATDEHCCTWEEWRDSERTSCRGDGRTGGRTVGGGAHLVRGGRCDRRRRAADAGARLYSAAINAGDADRRKNEWVAASR